MPASVREEPPLMPEELLEALSLLLAHSGHRARRTTDTPTLEVTPFEALAE